MSEANPIPNMAEAPKEPDAIPRAALDWSVGPVLNAQADLLAGAETTVVDWLRRRHEAVVDTQQLIASVHPGVDPADIFRAQRDWLSRSFRRLAADVEAYHSASRQLMDRAPSWFPNGGWMSFARGAGGSEIAASQAAVTRAAGKPLRMANKSE
jgi:hypothetical protein